ncbi:hypothetical protein ABZ769_33490 [Streptomyces olivoreticuli]
MKNGKVLPIPRTGSAREGEDARFGAINADVVEGNSILNHVVLVGGQFAVPAVKII